MENARSWPSKWIHLCITSIMAAGFRRSRDFIPEQSLQRSGTRSTPDLKRSTLSSWIHRIRPPSMTWRPKQSSSTPVSGKRSTPRQRLFPMPLIVCSTGSCIPFEGYSSSGQGIACRSTPTINMGYSSFRHSFSRPGLQKSGIRNSVLTWGTVAARLQATHLYRRR